MADPQTQSWTILSTDANGYSDSIDMKGYVLCGIDVPAMQATTDRIYFEHSDDDTTWVPVYWEGVRLRVTCSTSAAITEQVNPAKFADMRYVRIQAVDAAGAAVQQAGGDKTVTPRARVFR